MTDQEKILVKVIDLTLEGGSFFSRLERDRGQILCYVKGNKDVPMMLFEWQPIWRQPMYTSTVHPAANLEPGEVLTEIKELWPLMTWTLTARMESDDELLPARFDAEGAPIFADQPP